jgi:FKBP-type peptidyl-prolyl cis-trans isomerase FklB
VTPKLLSLPKSNFKTYEMKIKGLTLFAVAVAMLATSCTQTGIRSAKVKTTADSLAYTFGVANYFYYQKDSIDIDPILFAKGMIDSKNGKNTIDEQAAQAFIMHYMQKKQADQMRKMYGKNIDASEKFLADNKKREGVKETESGLQYEVITMGNGPVPTTGQKVKIQYTGTFIDGKKFDSSLDHEGGKPAEMDLNRVIPGMKEAILLMPVGSKFKFYIPYELAYGERGGGQIEPYSTLVFDVELIEIVK